MGGRWDGPAGRTGRRRRLLAAALVAVAAIAVAGPAAGAAAAGGSPPADDLGTVPAEGTPPAGHGTSATARGGIPPAAHGGIPPTGVTAPPGGDATPVADRGSDGGAVAVWVAGEVILLVAGAGALRLWTGRRSRRRPSGGGRPVPVDTCDACAIGGPCADPSALPGRCDRPPVRIRL
ncbi:MAG TPA: hypothetical protein VFZ79_12455 [Acidimicrobiales bacterium]